MRGTEGTLAFLKLTQQIDTQFVDSGAEGGLVLIAFPYVLTMTVMSIFRMFGCGGAAIPGAFALVVARLA